MKKTLIGLIFLASCSAGQQATVAADVATAQSKVSTAINFYGIAKGIAFAAEASDPSLIPTITKLLSVSDPVVASVTAASSDTSVDVPTLLNLVAQLTSQAQAIEVLAAPAIKVVSN